MRRKPRKEGGKEMGVFDNPTVTKGRFMSAADVKAGAVCFTVSALGVESFPDGVRIVLDGQSGKAPNEGRKTSLVLSPRNGNFIRSFLAGANRDESALVGGHLTLSTQSVMFKGEVRDSITIGSVTLAAAANPAPDHK